MYNPSRGGVRGGADQFTWESVKSDKHRENYLGHSLKAPVGRWQKGKDLSWYAKERHEADGSDKTEQSEFAAIKRAEEEAMLIALGHNVVRKGHQSLTKEEMKEALRRNIGQRDELNVERIDGVGASSRRSALLSGESKASKNKNEGVLFDTPKETAQVMKVLHEEVTEETSAFHKRKKKKKSSKKHKKDKKTKKHHQDSTNSEASDSESNHRKHKRHKKDKSDSGKKSRPEKDRENDFRKNVKEKNCEKLRTHDYESVRVKKYRHDTSESD